MSCAWRWSAGRWTTGIIVLALLVLAVGSRVETARAEPTATDQTLAVLVFSKTTGYRHDSIPAGIAAIKALGTENGFRVDSSEDGAVFTDTTLAQYRLVIFLNTTGDVLDAHQQAAFESFVRRGGGFVGVHSASDTEYDWPWYGQLVGSYFRSHPAIQPATLHVVEAAHPSTRHLPADWMRTDEWYNFRYQPEPRVTVLLRIDESSYTGGTMGVQHPVTWCHTFDGGRAWYTALGHTRASYQEPLFLQHLLGGIRWAAGATPDQ